MTSARVAVTCTGGFWGVSTETWLPLRVSPPPVLPGSPSLRVCASTFPRPEAACPGACASSPTVTRLGQPATGPREWGGKGAVPRAGGRTSGWRASDARRPPPKGAPLPRAVAEGDGETRSGGWAWPSGGPSRLAFPWTEAAGGSHPPRHDHWIQFKVQPRQISRRKGTPLLLLFVHSHV